MANSLFSQSLDPKSQVSRNGFDRTSRQVFSTKVGLLNTPKQIFTKPGGEYQIDMSQVLRTKPFVEAAFARFDVNYEWFRVHINDLYSDFNRWAAQRGDAQIVSDLTLNDQHELPYFNLRQFMNELFPYLLFDYISTLGNVDDDRGITTFESVAVLPLGSSNQVTTKRVQWQLQGEIVNDSSNRLLILYSDNTPFESVAWSIVRNLDMMCYGNFLPWFQLCMSLVAADGASLSSEEIYMEFDSFNAIVEKWFSCLSDSGQYHALLNGLIPDVDVNLWRPLAYNKVFDNIYRNAYYDNDYYLYYNFGSSHFDTVGRYRFPYVTLFNLDDFIHSSLEKNVFQYPLNYPTEKYDERNIPGFFRLCAIFASKYHQYGKDMFTSLLPSTQFGDVSVMTDDRSWLSLQTQSTVGSSNRQGIVSQGSSSAAAHALYNDTTTASANDGSIKFRFDPALAISILNQRKAEALQRFNENTLRVGGRLKDNFNAHFGAIPKSDLSHSAYYMGSFDGRIDLNPVTATSSTAYGSLGEMGATGVGVIQGDKIRFSTDDFDVLICMMYITKPTEYDAYGVDRFNQILDPWDLPLNEIQNISLHPVDALTVNQFDLSHRERILGYLPAFIQYKTDVDLVHGEFYSQNPFGFPKDGTFDSGDVFLHLGQKGLFSSFVTPKDMLSAPEYLQFLYINPNSVDNVFGFKANSLQSTDQFEVNLGIQVYAVEHLSVLGLPY